MENPTGGSQQAPAQTTETPEVSKYQEQIAKQQEQIDNLNKALKADRSELTNYKKLEEEKSKQEAIAKWEFEKVSQSYESKIAELSASDSSKAEKLKSYEEVLTKQIEDQIAKFSPEQKEFFDEITKFVGADDLMKKMALVPQALKIQAKPQPYGQSPQGQKPATKDASTQALIQEAIKRGDFATVHKLSNPNL